MLLGAVPHDRVASYLGRTDICVFPSIWENDPFACKEAMAAAREFGGGREKTSAFIGFRAPKTTRSRSFLAKPAPELT